MDMHALPGFQPPRLLLSQTLAVWLARQTRRPRLVVWWAATFQLWTQFRHWRRARRLRRIPPARQGWQSLLIETAEPTQIAIRRDADPTVSIIIPCFGKIDFTLRCLASIAAYRPQAAIEVIVVDDATADGSTACLATVPGIRLIINPRNLGFLRACNAAARVATGEFLLFLNNDTQVLPGWLDPLLTPFRQRRDVGAIGSKLLYPDGRLQEAGCIIWRDGSGWTYGRLDDPDRPVYNYLREVDYCSGASLMVPRALCTRIGGFDDRYALAYCEDSDLAFRLRELGYKVIYQPRSQVVHREGISHGRHTVGGIKACQVRNVRKFSERWRSVLARDHLPNGEHVMRARDRARRRDIILVIDHDVPQLDRDAGSRTMLCIVRALLQAGLVVKGSERAHPAAILLRGFCGAARPTGSADDIVRRWIRALAEPACGAVVRACAAKDPRAGAKCDVGGRWVQSIAGGARIGRRGGQCECQCQRGAVARALSRIAVVPLHSGAGVKLKVVEAVREGLPLVTTSIGAQRVSGLESVASIHDDAGGIADAVCRLLADDALWVERSAAQIE